MNGGIHRYNTFVPEPDERPLCGKQVLEIFGGFYAADRQGFEAHARRVIRETGLYRVGDTDPHALINEALAQLAQRADRTDCRPIYRSGGPGLLMRQIEYTGRRLAANARRQRTSRELPLGTGSEVASGTLGSLLDRRAVAEIRGGAFGDEDSPAWRRAVAGMHLLVPLFRAELAAALEHGRIGLTEGERSALASTWRRNPSGPLCQATRAAAKRARAKLWPWIVDWWSRHLGVQIPEGGNRARRLGTIIETAEMTDLICRREVCPVDAA